MIKTETVTIGGQSFVHTFSDDDKTIIRDGVEYGEAYDPVSSGRVYVESEHDIDLSFQDLKDRYMSAKTKVKKIVDIKSKIEALRDSAVLPSTKAIYDAILELFEVME
jgi:hypothetical protein